jgi:hypothetical protein
MRIGLNLAENNHYGPPVWANLFLAMDGSGDDRSNIGWGMPDKPYQPNPNLKLDANGSPLADAGRFSNAVGYPSGVYDFTMEGSGTPVFSGKGKFSPNVIQVVGNRKVGKVAINADNGSALNFKIIGVDPNDPPRNLKLMLPTPEGEAIDYDRVVNPAFAEAHKWVDGPIRVVTSLNRSNTEEFGKIGRWADRVKPTEPQTTRRGMSYEYIIALANGLDKDIWLCVPDRADDDFVKQLGLLLKAELKPSLKVWIEYSNECGWNFVFSQTNRIRADAAINPALTATEVSDRVWQQVAFQARRLGFILKPILGDRVQVVYGVQAAWPEQAEIGLKYLGEKFNDTAKYVDALAVTNYRKALDTSTLDSIFASIDFEGKPAKVGDRSQRDKDKQIAATARRYALKLLAYESSIIVPGKQADPDPRDLAQLDARMNDAVFKLQFNFAEDTGAHASTYFIGIGKRKGERQGRWAAAETLQSAVSGLEPKWEALKQWASQE